MGRADGRCQSAAPADTRTHKCLPVRLRTVGITSRIAGDKPITEDDRC